MTEDEARARVRVWQKRLSRLGIRHWEISVEIVDDIESAKPDVRAQVSCSPYYADADIEIARVTLAAPDIDYVIVHELLHIAWRDYDDAVHAVCDLLGREAKELHHQRLDHEGEGLLDAFARLIVDLHAEKE